MNMAVRGITRRWIVNSLTVIVLVLVTLVTILSVMMQQYVYNSILSQLKGRSEEVVSLFSSGHTEQTSQYFYTSARSYIENFTAKNEMEVMAVDQNGQVFITSTGFAPDNSQDMPDYTAALQDENGMGVWVGHLNTGEKAMAVTKVIFGDNDGVVGALRYVVSMEKADRQVLLIIGLLALGCILIISFIVFSNLYFMKSIVTPVRQIGATAKRIAQGDFNARIQKSNDDEIGQLCDNINDMAVELGAAEKLKNEFISSVSHELRTPLTAIKGWAETLQGGGMDSGTYEKGMNVIIRESERLSGLVEELLDFSRMQNGRMTLMMEKIDLLAELGEAVYMFSDRAEAEHKFLLYEEPAMLSPVLGDINRLRQVFVNIIDNALKYTAEGGTVEITAKEQTGFIRVVISDNGCGIPAEHLPNVKKKFYKANQTVRGSGIGLALADEIMKLHGGQLDIESHENVGTAVTITIPVLEEDDGI